MQIAREDDGVRESGRLTGALAGWTRRCAGEPTFGGHGQYINNAVTAITNNATGKPIRKASAASMAANKGCRLHTETMGDDGWGGSPLLRRRGVWRGRRPPLNTWSGRPLGPPAPKRCRLTMGTVRCPSVHAPPTMAAPASDDSCAVPFTSMPQERLLFLQGLSPGEGELYTRLAQTHRKRPPHKLP